MFKFVAQQRAALATGYEAAFGGDLVEADAVGNRIREALLLVKVDSVPASLGDEFSRSAVVLAGAASWLDLDADEDPTEARASILVDGRLAVEDADLVLGDVTDRIQPDCPGLVLDQPTIQFPAE